MESITLGDAQIGLLGHVASTRGVRLIAIEGMPNGKIRNQYLTTFRCFAYLSRLPADGAIGTVGKPLSPLAPLSFSGPDIAMETSGSTSLAGALCVFEPAFTADVSTHERWLRFSEIDLLPSIKSERLADLGRTMLREAVRPGFASALSAEAMGLQIAIEVARCDGANPPTEQRGSGGLAPWQMRRIEAYVFEHLSADLTLHDLAQLCGISVRHLSRTIRRAKGVSAYRWIANCRLAEAQRLLADTALPVFEIAQRSAFHSAAAFATAFRDASGYAPSEFRRRILSR
jgi:AraC-like DNA-binding protein